MAPHIVQTGKFANCAPEIRITQNFSAPDFRFCAPNLQTFDPHCEVVNYTYILQKKVMKMKLI